ncbi:MAG: hypothetical protein VX936_13785, partial [Planctomycetota bacterium]|nr:hypothetical protein [Planctomycetota bacterium]
AKRRRLIAGRPAHSNPANRSFTANDSQQAALPFHALERQGFLLSIAWVRRACSRPNRWSI